MLLLCVLLVGCSKYYICSSCFILIPGYVIPGKSKHDRNSTKNGIFWWPGGFEWSLGLLSEGEAAEHKTTRFQVCRIFFTSFPRDPIAHQSWEQFRIEATNTSCVSFRWLFTPNHYHSQTIPEVWITPWMNSRGCQQSASENVWSSFQSNFGKYPDQKISRVSVTYIFRFQL